MDLQQEQAEQLDRIYENADIQNVTNQLSREDEWYKPWHYQSSHVIKDEWTWASYHSKLSEIPQPDTSKVEEQLNEINFILILQRVTLLIQ